MTRYPPFYSDCVGWPSDQGHALDILIEEADEIPLDRFRSMIGEEAFGDLAQGLGYATGDERGLRIEQDYHVRCELHAGSGVPFLVHSAIEHVFAEPETIARLQERAMRDLQEEMASRDALVLVHPGSMCGSARMSMGRPEADEARSRVMERVRLHEGPLIVIDGAMSDELNAGETMIIENALDEAAAWGHPAMRLWGCDAGEAPFQGWTGRALYENRTFYPGQSEAAGVAAKYLEGCQVSVTGAWAAPDGAPEGCVNEVVYVMRDALGEKSEVGIDETALQAPDQDEPDPSDFF